jgi:hypothetical protein
VVEHYLDTVGVSGSNPLSRTIFANSRVMSRVTTSLWVAAFYGHFIRVSFAEKVKIPIHFTHNADGSAKHV